jgi:hypothetical protein
VPTRRMSFERAKIIGRRNTFLDGLFAIAFNRDLELMDMLVRLALYLVLNISWAMFFMFWIFLAGLPTFIWTFGASWVRLSSCMRVCAAMLGVSTRGRCLATTCMLVLPRSCGPPHSGAACSMRARFSSCWRPSRRRQ